MKYHKYGFLRGVVRFRHPMRAFLKLFSHICCNSARNYLKFQGICKNTLRVLLLRLFGHDVSINEGSESWWRTKTNRAVSSAECVVKVQLQFNSIIHTSSRF